MNGWIILIIIAAGVLLGHISGIIFGPWWKRWALKIVGFPKEAIEFFMWFSKASSDFKWTPAEKEQGKQKFNDLLEALTPPPLIQKE